MIIEKKMRFNLGQNMLTKTQPDMVEKVLEQLQDPRIVEKMIIEIQETLDFQQLYQAAIRQVNTKLEILDDEFHFKYDRNPIHHMESRLKSPQSIIEKLYRKGFEISAKSAQENITDIAGVRVICSYIEDIYSIAKLLKQQDDVILVRETDYIRNPKANGYRSLHLVVNVPVYLSDGKELVPVEIQIRTIAMDFWASLEHQIRYKGADNIPDELIRELSDCADVIAKTDLRMQNINRELESIFKPNSY